jgi:hypothetical protein
MPFPRVLAAALLLATVPSTVGAQSTKTLKEQLIGT